jgi:hypothetical protein
MKTDLLKNLRRHFSTDYVSAETNRRYIAAWCRQVRLLGDKYLLAQPVKPT